MTGLTAHRVRRISGVVSTDDIIPARYKHMHTDAALLAPHMFEAYAPGFAATFRPGDALVSDSTFGIGSSREQAVSTLRANGVTAVFAPRFGRILFRNCWNLALPAIELDTSVLADGAHIMLDLAGGQVLNNSAVIASFPVPSDFLLRMISGGGLLRQISLSLAEGA